MDETEQILRVMSLRLQHDPDPAIRMGAAERLGSLRDQRALPYLLCAALWDDSPLVRYTVARVLGKIGEPAVPALILLLNYDNTELHMLAKTYMMAVDALLVIGKPAVVPLIEKLGDGDAKVRVRAVEVLVKLANEVDVDLSLVSAKLQAYCRGMANPAGVEGKEAKAWASKSYTDIAEASAKRKKADMPGELLPARIPKPPKKPGIYRARRVSNG